MKLKHWEILEYMGKIMIIVGCIMILSDTLHTILD